MNALWEAAGLERCAGYLADWRLAPQPELTITLQARGRPFLSQPWIRRQAIKAAKRLGLEVELSGAGDEIDLAAEALGP